MSESFAIESSTTTDQVGIWSADLPVHGVGPNLEGAEADFLDALADYADAWVGELRHAPNHKQFGNLVRRILSYEGDREGLRRAVFGSELTGHECGQEL